MLYSENLKYLKRSHVLTYGGFSWFVLEVVEEHRVVVEVLNVVPVRDILLQLTNVAMENGVTRPVWQPVKKSINLQHADTTSTGYCI